MNAHDSERISGLLEADGMERVELDDDADVVVLNTCCIRENADNKLYGTLGQLRKWKAAKEGRRIVVGGCLSQKDKDSVATRAPWVDVVMGTHNVHRTTELLTESIVIGGPVTEILDEAVLDDYALFPSALPARRETTYNAWVTIQIGCDNSCSYCIVPSVRGREISRPFADVIGEVENLANSGVTEITLLGQNVNSYGRDITLAERHAGSEARVQPMFANLLRAAGAVPGIMRVRYVSPHPKDMRVDVLEAMANTPAVCEHLHYPLQSGSDRVLALMHRGYTAARYMERLADARRLIPDLSVTTDIIVGFPGETEEDFQCTLEIASQAMFDNTFEYIFSPRDGTEAATMGEHFIDPAIVSDRFDRLKIVVEHSALIKHEERVGRIEEVVVQGPSRRNPSVYSGRTRQYKLVHFSSDVPLRPGTYATVQITKAAPHFLTGFLVEVLQMATHKIRIPVASV
jgi:tRNA-2-methylthio-N6-dimethylallyladenosine synthase